MWTTVVQAKQTLKTRGDGDGDASEVVPPFLGHTLLSITARSSLLTSCSQVTSSNSNWDIACTIAEANLGISFECAIYDIHP